MPYMKNGKRDYKREDKWDANHKDPNGLSRAKARDDRHEARATLAKAGKVHKGDGKQVDHIKPLGMGGSTNPYNLRVTTAKANESFRRNAKGGIVSQTSKKEKKNGKG